MQPWLYSRKPYFIHHVKPPKRLRRINNMAEGGYTFRFLQEHNIKADLKCPICLLVLKSPHLTDCCGGHFCEGCINRVKSKNGSCPKCRESFKTMIDKNVDREIRLLPLYCVNASKGCGWTGALKDLERHIEEGNTTLKKGVCQYQGIQCPLKCGETIMRKDVLNHKRDLCILRPFICPYCSISGTFKYVSTKHYPSCQKFPLACPNSCTEGTIPRCKMGSHLDVCPLQPMVCPYAEHGCTAATVRRDLEKHVKDAVHSHLDLMKKSFDDQKEEYKKMQQENTDLREKQEEMYGEILLIKCSIMLNSPDLVKIPNEKSHHKIVVKKGRFLYEDVDIKIVAICSEMGFTKGLSKDLNDRLNGQLQQTVNRRYQNGKPDRFDVFTVHCLPSTIYCRYLVVANILDRTLGSRQDHHKFFQQILHCVFKEADTLEMPSVAIAPNTFAICGFPRDTILPSFIRMFSQYQFTCDEFLTDVRFLVPT